jgi:hypothetical protein
MFAIITATAGRMTTPVAGSRINHPGVMKHKYRHTTRRPIAMEYETIRDERSSVGDSARDVSD